jgi:hypothetical protein
MTTELTKADGRLHTIKNMRVCPWDEVMPIIKAKAEGASDWQAANMAGYTKAEVDLMVKLGIEGHPCWGQFSTMWLQARAEPAAEVTIAQKNRAINGSQKDVDNWQMQNDPGVRELRQAEIEAAHDQKQIGGFKVILNRFDAPPEPKQIPETLDVE